RAGDAPGRALHGDLVRRLAVARAAAVGHGAGRDLDLNHAVDGDLERGLAHVVAIDATAQIAVVSAAQDVDRVDRRTDDAVAAQRNLQERRDIRDRVTRARRVGLHRRREREIDVAAAG